MSGIDDPRSEDFADLTDFQRDILVILAADKIYKGLEVKEVLESYYKEEVNHGRLYPNLDSLVEKGLISKVKIDNRTNGYDLTHLGEAHLKQRMIWERSMWDQEEHPADSDLLTEQKSEDTDNEAESSPEKTSKPAETIEGNGSSENDKDVPISQNESEALINEILRLLSDSDTREDLDI